MLQPQTHKCVLHSDRWPVTFCKKSYGLVRVATKPRTCDCLQGTANITENPGTCEWVHMKESTKQAIASNHRRLKVLNEGPVVVLSEVTHKRNFSQEGFVSVLSAFTDLWMS